MQKDFLLLRLLRGFEGNVLKPALTVSTHNVSVKAAKLLLWR